MPKLPSQIMANTIYSVAICPSQWYFHPITRPIFSYTGTIFAPLYTQPPISMKLLLPIGLPVKPGSLEQNVEADKNGPFPLSLVLHPEVSSFQLVAKRAIACTIGIPVSV